MQQQDLAREATLVTSTTVAGGYVTITFAAVASMRSVIFGLAWLTDLAPTAAVPIELRGGAAGTTVLYALFGTSGAIEFPNPIFLGTASQSSDIRLPATTNARLSVRYAYSS